MRQPGVQLEADDSLRETGPFIGVALLWIAGTAAGLWLGGRTFWLSAGLFTLAAVVFCFYRRGTGIRIAGALCVVTVAAGWASLRQDFVPANHIGRYLREPSQLAEMTGTVASRVNVMDAQRGAFAKFSYEPPATMFSFEVETIVVTGESQPATGMLLAKIEQADLRLQPGDRIRITGWLAPIDGPYNPGERDFRKVMRERGIDGRITMRVRGNCDILERGSGASLIDRIRHSVSDAAASSLRIGMGQVDERIAFLETILLGRRTGDLGDLRDSFRAVGLAHLLSISGAHLGILLFLVWMVVRYFVPHPKQATLIVLVVLILYLSAVPLRVPIVRAGIMAGLICVGFASGRRVRAVDMIALSAVLVLIWRPTDLFSAGFQLSFGIVAGLLAFTTTVSHWLWPEPPVIAPVDQIRMAWLRRIVDYVAVNVVAFLIAFPLVAFHFQIISPLAVVLSILAFPVVTVLLGLGYLKIIVGLILPSGGVVLGGPLGWIADTMTGLVEHATTWPAATVELAAAPSILWTVSTLMVVVALFKGVFAWRRGTAIAALAICVLWLALPNVPAARRIVASWSDQPALQLNMFAVGDGSCFLVRVYPNQADEHTIMFDCGSQAFLDTGVRTIGPGLRALGVSRIDTLFISHADLDHFSGVLDMLDFVAVERVLVPPQLLALAEAKPASTAGHLVTELHERGLHPQPIHRGWSEQWSDAEASVLWPPAEFGPDRANDTSLVLSLTIAGRRLLLNGDIAREAVPGILASGDDLRADITDLPHHGSFIEESPQWFRAVKPAIVLQSSGPTRLRNDKWAETLKETPATRLVTATLGMVEVRIAPDGSMEWSSFRESPQ